MLTMRQLIYLPPTVNNVVAGWENCLVNQTEKLIADLEPLNTNRLKVLSKIAILNGIKEPNSKYFLDKVAMPLGSIQKAITFLLDYDYIYRAPEGKLDLVDPLLKSFICYHVGN